MADETNPNPAGEPATDPVTEPAASSEPKPDDEGLKRALNSERQLRAAAEKRLKAFEDAQKTENEKLQERAVTAERELGELRVARMRDRIAAKHELPAELADRLQGATEDELDEDAKRLAGLVTPIGDLGGRRGGFGAPKGSDSNDMNAQIRRMTGRT